jgi:hypothetical protein
MLVYRVNFVQNRSISHSRKKKKIDLPRTCTRAMHARAYKPTRTIRPRSINHATVLPKSFRGCPGLLNIYSYSVLPLFITWDFYDN